MQMQTTRASWRRWTSEDDNVLRSLWGQEPRSEIARQLSRTPGAVRSRAQVLGLRPGAESDSPEMWSSEERSRLIELWPRLRSCVLIGAILGRSHTAIQTAAMRLGLPKRDSGPGSTLRLRWSEEDLARLAESTERHRRPDGRVDVCAVADDVGRSVDAVTSRMFGGRLLKQIPGDEVAARIYVGSDRLPTSRGPSSTKSQGDPRKVGRQRACMCCKEPFWSEGAHNRLCRPCKESDGERTDPFAAAA